MLLKGLGVQWSNPCLLHWRLQVRSPTQEVCIFLSETDASHGVMGEHGREEREQMVKRAQRADLDRDTFWKHCAEDVAQLTECLLRMHKALCLNPSSTQPGVVIYAPNASIWEVEEAGGSERPCLSPSWDRDPVFCTVYLQQPYLGVQMGLSYSKQK